MTNARDDSGPCNARLVQALTRLNAASSARAAGSDGVFAQALEVLLDLSGASWGVIAELRPQPDGAPRLHPLALSKTGEDGAARLAALARMHGLDAGGAGPAPDGASSDAEALPLVYGGALVGLAGLAGGRLPAAALSPLAGVLAGLVAAETARAERDRQAERAQLAVAGSDAAIWDWDIKTDTVWWSDQLKAMIGVPDDFEPDFSVIHARVHPDDRDAFAGAVEATLEHDAPYRTTMRLARQDGGYATIRTTGRLLRDASGAPERLVGVQIDVSREAGLEREMAQTGAMIEIAGAAGLATWRWNTADEVFHLDDRLCAMLERPGMAGRAIPADEVFAILHPGDRALVAEELDRVRERRRHVFREEHRVLTPDGRTIWLRAHGGVLADGLIVGVVEDRTAAKHAELELAAAKERYDLAVSGSLIAVWDWDVETGALYWSDRFLEMLDLDRADFTGRYEDFTTRLHPDDRARVEAALQAHVDEGEPYDIELRMRHADGRWITLQARGAGRPGPDGRRTRMAGSVMDVSAEREAQQAAADAALKVALAARHAGIGPIEIDLEAGEMRGDASLGRLIGRPGADRISFNHAMAIIHPGDAPAVEAKRRALAEGRADHLDSTHRIVRPDGSVAWTHTVAMVTRRSGSGGASLLSGVVIDQTERRETERALALEKERYDLAVGGSHMAIWDQNLITGEVYWSPRLGEIMGYFPVEGRETKEAFVARTHPDDLERVRRDFRAMVEHDAPYDVILRLRRRDGGYVHVRSRGGTLRDETGTPVRVCGSLTDVTHEIEADAKARLSGRRAELALEAAHLGVWDYDAETARVTVDATLAALVGDPALAGRTVTQEEIMAFTFADDLSRVKADLALLHTSDRASISNEHRIVRPDGETVWVRADVGVAERAPDGSAARLIGIVQDLSGVKLTEDLLRGSAEAAREASEAKSQFLATMSHEIRTPLNGVLGVVQLLERTELDARQRRYVDTIKASGRSLADVIEEVLDISRIEAGRLQLKPEAAMVADMLDRACAPSRAMALQKGVDLNLTISGDLTEPVMVDPRRVAQMVGNLIGNAVKFTDKGGVRVRVGRPDKAVLRIEVEDDGPGVPEDMQEAVFERFTQADMSNSRSHEGAGLGLAIVRELAQLAGGVAGVRSRPGEGACFWIELPAPAAVRRPEAPRAAAPDTGIALRVLVVEDHPINRAVTAELVTEAGHHCETAESGAAALHALKTSPADLVLLDLHMPEMDGAQTLARIRRGEAGPADLPVYMVTADATPEARAKTLALGANGFFVKPLDSAALRRMLSAVANRSRSTG